MKNIILTACLLMAISGCTQVTRGVVAMKIDDQTAHVCLGKTETHIGDSLELYRNVCQRGYRPSSKPAGGVNPSCTKKHLGSGTVTELLNEHYSVAEFPVESRFEEGDVVEVGKK